MEGREFGAIGRRSLNYDEACEERAMAASGQSTEKRPGIRGLTRNRATA